MEQECIDKILAIVEMYPQGNIVFFIPIPSVHGAFLGKKNFTVNGDICYGNRSEAVFINLLAFRGDLELFIYVKISGEQVTAAYDNFQMPENFDQEDIACLINYSIPEKVDKFLTVMLGNWQKKHELKVKIEYTHTLCGKEKL